jgi:hypothetical protein
LVSKAFNRDAHETKVAVKILMRIAKGKNVSHVEIKFLKEQSIGIDKAIVGLQAVPSSSISIVAIEKFGQKHGFTIFPKAQVDPYHDKNEPTEYNNPSELLIDKNINSN